MDSNNKKNLSDKEINTIIKNYQEKADQIIRKMFNVSVQAHKKVDDVSYHAWKNKLKGNKV